MVPTKRSGCIPVGKLKFKITPGLSQVQYITAKITTEVNTIALRKLVIEFGIEIIKEIIGPGKIGLPDQGLRQIKSIRSSSTDQEAAFSFYNGPFESQPGGYQSNTPFPFKILVITIFHLDIQH